MIKPGWLPPRSPFGLIQEDIFPNEWEILVSCIMLNCTRRKQVEGVLPEFRRRWPTPQAFLGASVDEVSTLCRPLGFVNRRTNNLRKMSEAYLAGNWQHARELPGIGDYAADAWQIFCRGELPVKVPKDHALVQYYEWLKEKREKKIIGQAR